MFIKCKRNRKAATAIEYGALAGLIAIVIIIGLFAVGGNLKETYCRISSAIESSLGIQGGTCGSPDFPGGPWTLYTGLTTGDGYFGSVAGRSAYGDTNANVYLYNQAYQYDGASIQGGTASITNRLSSSITVPVTSSGISISLPSNDTLYYNSQYQNEIETPSSNPTFLVDFCKKYNGAYSSTGSDCILPSQYTVYVPNIINQLNIPN